ncbi:MAG: DUF5013 domain-containing protein [Pseudoflavonifractor sp.]|nr:DUF5013 domain-containing protein [Alloprevotella sp.]MCM1117293.1 DUF5013 domain-containing protein [Pseudoflavonifractor sp.]
MKRKLCIAAACALMLPLTGIAQEVDLTKYPDYSTKTNPNPALMIYGRGVGNVEPGAAIPSRSSRPDHVDNGKTKYFPPVFNQHGGSCGSASRIRYMFTEELASYRDVDAKLDENNYPTHFVWLLTNGNSGKNEFVQYIGVPSAAEYGGQTYSSLFGGQVETNNDFGWMNGYDKWLSAMHNRMLPPYNFTKNLGTEEGREAVKNYLWNHNGDPDFKAGGIVGLGVASAGNWQSIASTPSNDAIGVTGMKYVNRWGSGVDHAVTIVGYDDRIEFDLNGNGIYGEESADEKGAWIIVNSWGPGWCNGGFIYCPYAYAGPAFKQDSEGNWYFPGNWWTPEVYTVRKNYRPLRVIKLKMDYSHRSEMALSVGVSANPDATVPDKTIPMHHFRYAGDGNYGNTVPAPAIPMLGRWADGKLHDEPMEFGYDLTDLTDGFDLSAPLKYFLIIDTKSTAIGSGHIYEAAIMDYEEDPEGVELPFDLGAGGITIIEGGQQTVVTHTVTGRPSFPPRNAAITSAMTLTWDAPASTGKKVTGYEISLDGTKIATTGPSERSLDISSRGEGLYAIAAIYEGGIRSAQTKVMAPIAIAKTNKVIELDHAGFTVPNIFDNNLPEATIEFAINPATLVNWNQTAGPGWGKGFMFHANANGSFTAGWNTTGSNRTSTPAGCLKPGVSSHVAIVVKDNKVSIYIDGKKQAETTSTYHGIGGFGNLVFSSDGRDGLHGSFDEIRIWNVARSSREISASANSEYSGAFLPEGLVAYYKGDVITIDGKEYLRERVGGNHARLKGAGYAERESSLFAFSTPEAEALNAEIVVPTTPIYAGTPVSFSAKASSSVESLSWAIPGAGVKGLASHKADVTFVTPGQQTITLTATGKDGATAEATATVEVLPSPAPDAAFTATATEAVAGQRITFIVTNPKDGHTYSWAMPGADRQNATSAYAATAYSRLGSYKVTLTATAPDGRKDSRSIEINVTKRSPEAAFEIAEAVVVKGEAVTLTDASKYDPETWTWTLDSPGGKQYATDQSLSYFATTPGVYDVTLTVANSEGSSTATRQRGLTIVNADSGNGLTFTGNATVEFTQAPFSSSQKKLTVEWWMNPSRLETMSLGIGSDPSSFMLQTTANGAMILSVGGKETYTHDDFVIAGQWHHYAVTFSAGQASFYRDGKQLYSGILEGVAAIPAPATFAIGLPNAPMNGSIDELRIWADDYATDFSRLLERANRPLQSADRTATLLLHCDFNQDGGNVNDLSASALTGIRSGFGPDGDAWSPSKGVFSLCETQAKTDDVTSRYLKNYTKPFAYDSAKPVNNPSRNRWYAIKDWTLEGSYTNGSTTTGVHVDLEKNISWTVASGWDGFGELADHAAYQTIELPAGFYTFATRYDSKYEGQCGNSYLVVAQGQGLPSTETLSSEAIAYAAMKDKDSAEGRVNTLSFILPEPTTVSIGILVNMTGNILMAIEDFNLKHTDITKLEHDPTGINAPASDTNSSAAPQGIYDLQGRRLNAITAPGIYIVNGRKMIIR